MHCHNLKRVRCIPCSLIAEVTRAIGFVLKFEMHTCFLNKNLKIEFSLQILKVSHNLEEITRRYIYIYIGERERERERELKAYIKVRMQSFKISK